MGIFDLPSVPMQTLMRLHLVSAYVDMRTDGVVNAIVASSFLIAKVYRPVMLNNDVSRTLYIGTQSNDLITLDGQARTGNITMSDGRHFPLYDGYPGRRLNISLDRLENLDQAIVKE